MWLVNFYHKYMLTRYVNNITVPFIFLGVLYYFRSDYTKEPVNKTIKHMLDEFPTVKEVALYAMIKLGVFSVLNIESLMPESITIIMKDVANKKSGPAASFIGDFTKMMQDLLGYYFDLQIGTSHYNWYKFIPTAVKGITKVSLMIFAQKHKLPQNIFMTFGINMFSDILGQGLNDFLDKSHFYITQNMKKYGVGLSHAVTENQYEKNTEDKLNYFIDYWSEAINLNYSTVIHELNHESILRKASLSKVFGDLTAGFIHFEFSELKEFLSQKFENDSITDKILFKGVGSVNSFNFIKEMVTTYVLMSSIRALSGGTKALKYYIKHKDQNAEIHFENKKSIHSIYEESKLENIPVKYCEPIYHCITEVIKDEESAIYIYDTTQPEELTIKKINIMTPDELQEWILEMNDNILLDIKKAEVDSEYSQSEL